MQKELGGQEEEDEPRNRPLLLQKQRGSTWIHLHTMLAIEIGLMLSKQSEFDGSWTLLHLVLRLMCSYTTCWSRACIKFMYKFCLDFLVHILSNERKTVLRFLGICGTSLLSYLGKKKLQYMVKKKEK